MKLNFFKKTLILSAFFGVVGANFGLASAYTSNQYIDQGGCYLQKEYNYFMNQWTTNEICKPKFKEVPAGSRRGVTTQQAQQNNRVAQQQPQIVRNAPVQNTRPVANNYVYTQPTYSAPVAAAPAVPVSYFVGPGIGNRNSYTANNWNGYGSAANYLLGSFGGGTNSSGGSYLSSYGYADTIATYYSDVVEGVVDYVDEYVGDYFDYGYYGVDVTDNGYFVDGDGYDYVADNGIDGYVYNSGFTYEDMGESYIHDNGDLTVWANNSYDADTIADSHSGDYCCDDE